MHISRSIVGIPAELCDIFKRKFLGKELYSWGGAGVMRH